MLRTFSEIGWLAITAIPAVGFFIYVIVLRSRLRKSERDLINAIQKFEEINAQLRQTSGVDGLTGIPNRRIFDETLRREWTRNLRNRQPLAVLMVDIDRFKAHNDIHGHQAGDECLRQVAAILKNCVQRPADIVARYGGEEFGIILPGTETSGAIAVAERMRQEVEALELAHVRNPTGHDVTVSIGVAVLIPNARTSTKDIIAAADRALYTAKAVGRNQVILADNEQTIAAVS